MRVIAGQFRGRPLRAPEGDHTRPTTDRVKESLMSTLYSAFGPLDGARVLDAFAGSGALGIECLSRGAESATFYELDKGAQAALLANIAALKIAPDRAVVRKADVLKNPPAYGAPFDVVLADPPYDLPADEVFGLIDRLRAGGLLAPDAVVIYEHAAKSDVAAYVGQRYGDAVEIVAAKRFGKTKTGAAVLRFA